MTPTKRFILQMALGVWLDASGVAGAEHETTTHDETATSCLEHICGEAIGNDDPGFTARAR